MNKRKELAKNTFILLLGKICTQFIMFFLLPLYTNILTTSEYGTVDLITTYVGLFAPFITLQLEMAAFRFLIDYRNDKKGTSKIITNIFVITIISVFIITIIWILFNLFIRIKYSIYLTIMIIISCFLGILMQTIRGIGDNVGYSISCIIAGVLNILLNILFLVVFKFRIEGMLLAQIISNLTCLLFIIFRIKFFKYINISLLNKNTCKELLNYSIPLMPNGIIWWIINVSDRTIITLMISVSLNGIYAISNKFSNFLIGIYNIYNMSWTESVSLHINDKDNFINDLINSSMKFFMSVLIIIISMMPIIFQFFIGNEYSTALYYVPILLVATYLNIFSSMIGAIYVALKKSKNLSLTSLFAGIINIIINILLIKRIKLYAAAISTLIAFGFMLIYRYIDIKRYFNLRFKFENAIEIFINIIIICSIYYFENKILIICGIIYTLLYFVITNFPRIKKYLFQRRTK